MSNANSNVGANVPTITAANVATANAAVNVMNKDKGYNLMYLIIMIVVILAAVIAYRWSESGRKAFEDAKIGGDGHADSDYFYVN